jgi:ribosomal-protein-alanine N-acetyltransferase
MPDHHEMKRALDRLEPGSAGVAVERVRPGGDTIGIEAIAAASFAESPFSVEEELARPWTRLWTARRAAPGASAAPGSAAPGSAAPGSAASGSDAREAAGFLVAWHVADELHILNVATAPAMRRRGVASALIQEALVYAASEHVRILLLEVRRSNRAAIKLYRGFGFTALGVRPRYYADNDEDAVEMILALDPESGRVVPGHDEIRLDG